MCIRDRVYIITGGLEIYTKHLEELLPLKVMGTQTRYEDEEYKVIGEACNGEEKVRRLKEATGGNYTLLEAYSDDDEEILYEAEKGYLLKVGKLELVEKRKK
jgi:phosphoserine phosphatase